MTLAELKRTASHCPVLRPLPTGPPMNSPCKLIALISRAIWSPVGRPSKIHGLIRPKGIRRIVMRSRLTTLSVPVGDQLRRPCRAQYVPHLQTCVCVRLAGLAAVCRAARRERQRERRRMSLGIRTSQPNTPWPDVEREDTIRGVVTSLLLRRRPLSAEYVSVRASAGLSSAAPPRARSHTPPTAHCHAVSTAEACARPLWHIA